MILRRGRWDGNIILSIYDMSWVLPPTHRKELFVTRKKGKLEHYVMAVPKGLIRRFHGWMMTRDLEAASRHDLVVVCSLIDVVLSSLFHVDVDRLYFVVIVYLCVLFVDFEAFTITSKESLEKGYDRFQKLLSQFGDAFGVDVSMKMLITSFLRHLIMWLFYHKPKHLRASISQAIAQEVIVLITLPLPKQQQLLLLIKMMIWNLEELDINWQIAMTAIKDQEVYKRRRKAEWMEKMALCGNLLRELGEASRGQDFKPVRTEKEALMTIDEGQINWVEQTADEELNHALMAFTVNNEVSMCSKLCLDSYNALQAKYDELQSEFGDQEAALVAHKLAVKKLESQLKASHKQQSSLNEKLNFQANQIFEKDEKLKKYRRIGMKAVKDKDALQKIVDSWFASSKNLWKLVDCGMSSTVKIGLGYGIKSNAEVLGYEEEISRGIFAFRETNAGYNDIPLYSRFKQVEYKGVPHPLSGDYTPREQEDIDDSLYEYGKYGPQPQSPSPTVSNASSIVFSICPSNDSDGELGAVSDANSTVYSTCQSNDSDGEQGTVSDHLSIDDPFL
ncbi:hypothetical protein Tco_0092874 [Tanacetum coccineum]